MYCPYLRYIGIREKSIRLSNAAQDFDVSQLLICYTTFQCLAIEVVRVIQACFLDAFLR